ncbi:ribonuclease H-like domain-containing protein [Daldinia bambusicola]|nr:ribonuclease H-like domain-containing protein [Daldinia bambusicola]
MSQAAGSHGKRCECALVFDDVQSLGVHIRETGHMKGKWCTQCSRPFVTKSALTQHKKKNSKHKNNATSTTTGTTTTTTATATTTTIATASTATPAAASKANAYVKRPRKDKPSAVASNSAGKSPSKSVAVTTKPPNTSQSVKGIKGKTTPKGPKVVIPNGSQAMQSPNTATSAPPQLASTMPSDPVTSKYPWSSGKQSTGLINSLTPSCHSQVCLVAENYYTGTSGTGKKWKHIDIRSFLPTPAKIRGVPRRKALVVDCEMVGVAGGRSELAYICIVDLFTREVLVNSLVLPTELVRDWRTKYSGVTPAMMAQARANNTVLNGWPTARDKLFELADTNTILIGHSLNNDLEAMHVIHPKVVDSAILVAEAVFGKGTMLRRKWGLKVLCEELLGIKIQASKNGHDCLEDTLASREIVLWCFGEREKLATWAKGALAKYEIEKKKREERERAKAQEIALKKQKEREREKEIEDMEADRDYQDRNRQYDQYDDRSVVSLEEYLEDCNYDPGYDPMWSD